MDKVKLFCSKDCPDTCEFYIKEDKNKKVIFQGIKESFIDNGFVCKKLKNFYKREVADNNSSSFVVKNGKKIFNEDAIKAFANYLKQNSDKKILFYRGSGSLGYYMGFWDKLFSNFKNCYFVNGSPCDETGITAHLEDFGVCTNPPIENLKNCNNILIFGKNAYTTSPNLFVYIHKLKKLGKKIIYIDPIKSETSKIADRFIQINPATDGLLAYSLLSQMGYVPKQDNLLEKTGVKKSDFKYLIKSIEPTKTGIIEGFGMQRYSNGKNIIQWINRLAYFTNNTDNLFYSRSSKEGLKKIKTDKRNIIDIADTTKYLQNNFFDTIVIVAANPTITMPQNSNWIEALKKSTVLVVDTNYTKTAKYADFFIKVDGMFAQDDIQGSYFFNKTLTRNRYLKSGFSDTDAVLKLSSLLNIDIELPKKEEIFENTNNNKRIFDKKQIDLLNPQTEESKIRLITLSSQDYLNSQTEQIETDTLYISKETASKHLLKSGDTITVKSSISQCTLKCIVSSRIKGNTAYAYKNRSACFNSLTESKPTDAKYGLSYYDLFISIE